MDQPVRILVVVNEPHTRDAALRLLEQADYQVWAASTTGQAWQMATEKMPDLILLAAAFPSEDRATLCRRVMAEPSLSSSVVALLSDKQTASGGQTKKMGAGAAEWIGRPISDCELLAHVQALAHFKRVQDELRLQAQELQILRPDGTIPHAQALAETKPDGPGWTLGILGTVQDIAECNDVQDALRKQKAQLEHLWLINLKLSAELDLPDLLQAITQNAIELLGGTAGGFYLHRPDLDLLEWVVDIDANILPLGTMVRRGEGLSGQVWDMDEPLLVDGYQQQAGQHSATDAQPWGGVVGVPLRYGTEADGGAFLGVLQVMIEEPQSFSRKDTALLRLFSNRAAAAIRNARLYELAQGEIAERKQAQEQLRRERDLASRIMESSPTGIVVLDRLGRIVYANPQVSRIWGRGLESLLLHRYDDPKWRVVSEDAQPRPGERGLFARAIHAGERVIGEQLTVEAEDGRKWSFSVSIIPLVDESGEINRLAALVEDITARLQAEKALRESESRYRRLVETSPDAITLADPEGNILTCNQQMATLHGFESCEAMIGINILDLFPPEELARARASLHKALMQGSVRALECRLLKKDGACFPAEWSASALYDEGGKSQAVVTVVRDITRRVRSQAALRESEERLRSTLSSLEDLVFVLDKDCRFVDYHQPAAGGELYLEPGAFLGRTVGETMPPEVAEPFQEAFNMVVATHEVQQFDYVLNLAGKQQRFSAKVSARFDREGAFDGATVVSRNVTERKQVVEALERRNRILETLNRLSEVVWSTPELDPLLNSVVQVAVQAIDATSGCICGWQEGTGTTTCLAEYCALEACDAERISHLGVAHHPQGDLVDPGDWLYSAHAYQVVHTDDEQAHDAHAGAKRQGYMEQLGVKSMLHVPLRTRGKPSGYIELRESRQMRSFAPQEVELVLALARQLSIGMENAHLYEQTQRELVERRQAQERLQASLQEKEVLLKEIHHRVKNNLQVISSLLDMQSLSIQSPEAGEALEDSQHRVRTMAFVHERLYQSEDLASIDVREYLESLAGYLLAAYERRTHRIHLNLQVEDVYLDLDMAIASGLIVNELVSNALKHAFPATREGDGEIGLKLAALDNGWFELQVRDNGVGFPPDLDPVGTQSLGLRLVNMLTQQLQGTLDLSSEAGTAFTITFPGAAGEPGERAGHG